MRPEQQTKVDAIATEISRLVNETSRRTGQALGRRMAEDHPTLVQSKMAMFLAFVVAVAEQDANDPRIAASVALARSIQALDGQVKTLPTI